MVCFCRMAGCFLGRQRINVIQFYYVSQAALYTVHEPSVCVGWKFMGGDMSGDLISRN